MPQIDNPRHEAFAQAMASGMSASDAYRKTYGVRGAKNVNAVSSRLSAKVIGRVREIQGASATSLVMDMRERREFLARVKRCHVDKINLDKDGDLVQEIIYKDGALDKIKLPGKRECIMADAELAGELVEKVDITMRVPLTPEQISEAVKRSPALAMIGRS